MTQEIITKHRNKFNTEYWDKVLEKYPRLVIEETTSGVSGAWSNTIDARLSINVNSNWESTLSHEMLHLYLDYLQIVPSQVLSQKSFDYFWISQLFQKSEFDDTGNLMSHVKMFPIFINLGYEEVLFIENFHTKEVSKTVIRELKEAYKFLKGNESLTRRYVRNYFKVMCLMRGCINKKIHYFDYKEVLKKTDNKLFSILSTFWDKWNSLDIHGGADSERLLNNIVDELYLGIDSYIDIKLN